MLPPESATEQLASLKARPQHDFCLRHVIAKRTSFLFIVGAVEELGHGLFHPPGPPFVRGGESRALAPSEGERLMYTASPDIPPRKTLAANGRFATARAASG